MSGGHLPLSLMASDCLCFIQGIPAYYLVLYCVLCICDKGFWLLLSGPFLLWTSCLFSQVSPVLTLPTGNQNGPATLSPFWNLNCSHTHSYLTGFLTTPLPIQTIQIQNIFWPEQSSLGLSFGEVIWVLAWSSFLCHFSPSFCSVPTTLDSNL